MSHYVTTCDEKLISMRDPLFVISASLEIIKHQSDDKSIQPEIKRIETALDKINKMLS